MADTTVKYFDSSMVNAPTLSGTAGALIGVLDACLVNGFGSITLDSLVITDNVATATYSSGHGLTMQGDAGPVILISGATPAELNNEFRVQSIPTASTFTFTTNGITNQTATGTIAAKRAPAGFEKTFSGTNKAAYRSSDALSTQCYLYMDDTDTLNGRVTGYESMSDIDSGTNAFGNALYWKKAQYANSTPIPAWIILADARCFYLFSYWHSSMPDNADGLWFGDIKSYRNGGDSYGCGIIGATSNLAYPGGNSTSQIDFYSLEPSSVGHYLARSYTAAVGAVDFGKTAHMVCGSKLGGGWLSYPDNMNSYFIVSPVHVYADSVIRGIMPGLYAPFHNLAPPNGTVVNGVPGVGAMKAIRLGYGNGTDYARAAMALQGPWR